ncbi:hypothetical protein CC77DRAFT_1026134 [Alternaria alternata]|uniref:Uncharacterized protein n=1 Tax=Alternaria alternata TaxID=5599 RepID=A0A177D371_ALTAL|nr:hypothetical protein CC77DRAFT_1026134 [Alternaria alternata]OAG14074.1 hypothetical protein CC77DRAFT_1026134 [Alternaria alternata]
MWIYRMINNESLSVLAVSCEMKPTPRRDLLQIKENIDEMGECYESENVWMVIAHDVSVLRVVDSFLKQARIQEKRNCKTATRWGFCGDFSHVPEASRAWLKLGSTKG